MFYLTTHSTHFIYGYMASDMVKDHSDSEKGNPLPPHGLLFPINSKSYFICRIAHTTAFVTPVVGLSFRLAAWDIPYHGFCKPLLEHWLEREIAYWLHQVGSIR